MSVTYQGADFNLTNSAVAVVTSSPLDQRVLTRVTAVNTDIAAPHSISVYRLAVGGTPGPTNIVVQSLPIAANTSVVVLPLGGMVVAGGQTLQALADNSSVVNMSVSYSINT
jgi:hypothetical protein